MKPMLLLAMFFTLASGVIAQKPEDPNARHLRAISPKAKSVSVAPRHHSHGAVTIAKPAGVDAQLNKLEHQTATLATPKPAPKTAAPPTATPKTSDASDGSQKTDFKYQPPKSGLTTTQTRHSANRTNSGIRRRVNGTDPY
jgi:hypothetical protein